MAAISVELLEKFLKGLCTEEEATAVEDYFQQHPEDAALLDEYEAADAETPLPEDFRGEMLAAIREETEKEEGETAKEDERTMKKRGARGRESDRERAGDEEIDNDRGRIRVLRTWVAAASVILLIAGGVWLQGRMKKTDNFRQPDLAAIWVGRHNADSRKISLLLPDSSEVTLSPGASIRYRQDFGRYDKREVKVEGQAAFSVMKNKQMPFIVYSEMVSTTVLGTVFEVTAEKGSDQIRVRLLSGKVVVGLDAPGHDGERGGQDSDRMGRDSDRVANDSDRHYILAPGEEFVFRKENRSVVIREFNKHNVSGYASNSVNGLPGGPDSLANWYMFNNQRLGEVFDQLSAIYHVEIQYSKEDIGKKYFIGRLEKRDSLNEIIRDIALLNHLTVTNRNGRYIITKRKP